jgi:hypothetical protein
MLYELIPIFILKVGNCIILLFVALIILGLCIEITTIETLTLSITGLFFGLMMSFMSWRDMKN